MPICEFETSGKSTYPAPKQPNLKFKDLTRIEKLSIFIGRAVSLGRFKKEGWENTAKFYLAKCPAHGFYTDYPHGKGQLQCPWCFYEWLKKSSELGFTV